MCTMARGNKPRYVMRGGGGGGGGRRRNNRGPPPIETIVQGAEEHRAPAPEGTSFELGLAIGFYMTLSNFIIQRMTEIQPEPYLDEVFHVPQTQRYCNGSYFEWDPKITTLPGTYVFASIVAKSAQQIRYFINFDPCSTYGLRLFNMVMGLQNFLFLKAISDGYMLGESERKRVLSAVNMAIFPVLYFFNFLFYTDVISTFWLLTMHYLFLRQLFNLSALLGALAVFTRQTNVVWVAWHGLMMGMNCLETAVNSRFKVDENPSVFKRYLQNGYHTAGKFLEEIFGDFHSLVGYGMVILHFVAFVVWNGGIVVGDKTAHVASLNFPQLGYFTLVFGFFCSPYIILRLPSTLKYILRRKLCVTLGILAFTAAVHFNTVAHPYLLADNRHYPFYLWKNVFQAYYWARYALIPFYVLVWAFIFENCENFACGNYALALFICATVQLVPQLLLEFRYFIPIFLLTRVAIREPTMLELVCEFVINFGVNIITFGLFGYKPFFWPNEDAAQRFMW